MVCWLLEPHLMSYLVTCSPGNQKPQSKIATMWPCLVSNSFPELAFPCLPKTSQVASFYLCHLSSSECTHLYCSHVLLSYNLTQTIASLGAGLTGSKHHPLMLTKPELQATSYPKHLCLLPSLSVDQLLLVSVALLPMVH